MSTWGSVVVRVTDREIKNFMLTFFSGYAAGLGTAGVCLIIHLSGVV